MKIKIYHRAHVLLAADILRGQLNKLGHEAELVGWCDPDDETLYIIYCIFCIEQLPRNYIVYQTEVPGSKWWNAGYYAALNNAKAIWDYAFENTKSYSTRDKTQIVTPGIQLKKYQSDIPKSKIVFYGALNERRNALLTELHQDYSIEIIEGTYGNGMWDILYNTKIVLNFHHYPKAPLEVFRINEALSIGCHVISEPGAGMDRYTEQVYFASQPAEFRACINKASQRDFNYDLTPLDNFNEVKNAMEKL